MAEQAPVMTVASDHTCGYLQIRTEKQKKALLLEVPSHQEGEEREDCEQKIIVIKEEKNRVLEIYQRAQ